MKTRTIVFFILGMFVLNSIFAQVPQAFKYQAVIRDTTGQVFQNQLISLRIAILKGDAQGEEVYSEIHDVWTDEFGLVNLNIGEGLEVSNDFSEIPWGDDTYFIQVEMDMDGGMNYHLLGTSQLKAVPYALYAGSSGTDSWKQSDVGIYYNDGKVGIGTTDPGQHKLRVETTADGGDERAIAHFRNNSNAVGSLCNLYISAGESGSTVLNYTSPHYIHWGGKYKSHTMLQNNGKGLVFRTGQNDEGRVAFEFKREMGSSYTYDEKVSIKYNGFMGIGTTNPITPLHIKGTSNLYEGRDILLVQNNSNDDVSIATIKIKSGNENTSTILQHTAESYQWQGRSELGMLGNDGQGLVLAATNEEGEIRFETGGAGLEKERMRITEDGNIGIGTTTPQRKLHINDVMRLEPRYTSPENPSEGDMYMDGNNHVLKVYNGTEWKSCW